MKKVLLTMLSLAMVVAVQATVPALQFQSEKGVMPMRANSLPGMRHSVPQRVESGTGEIRYCGDAADYLGLGFTGKVRMFVQVPDEMVKMYDGVEITSVSSVFKSNKKDVTVFVTSDLDNLENTKAYTYQTAEKWETVTLDTPYKVDGNKSLYFGYEATMESDYIVPVDLMASAGEGLAGGLWCINPNTNKSEVFSLNGQGYGNFCAYASFNGKVQDMVIPEVLGIFSNMTFQTSKMGEKVPYEIDIKNYGSLAITSATASVSIDGGQPVEFDITGLNITTLKSDAANFELEMPAVAGRHSVNVKVTKINGEAIEPQSRTNPVYVLPEDANYTQRFVCEEFTGLWCGWCPIGIVGLESASEKYGNNFIGIPVHYDDDLATDSYFPLVQNYSGGSFPSMTVNRDPNYLGIQPYAQYFDILYPIYTANSAPVDMQLKAVFDDRNPAKTTATMTFVADEDNADYKVAFAVLAKGMSGNQTNYFAGGQAGAMGGWERKGQSVYYEFPLTARHIYDVWGINNSVPKTIKAGEPISFEYDVPMTGVKRAKYAVIVAMLLDGETGCVVNAAVTDYESGVECIDNDGKLANVVPGKGMITVKGEVTNTIVYSMSGAQMACINGEGSVNLPAGIYVVNVDGKAVKAIVR